MRSDDSRWRPHWTDDRKRVSTQQILRSRINGSRRRRCARHGFEQRRIGIPRHVLFPNQYDPQFDTTAFHLHWHQASDSQGLRACFMSILRERNSEADPITARGELRLFNYID